MIMSDCHMHTDFSPDSGASMESMVEGAIARALTHIALTDHVDYGGTGPHGHEIDYAAYMSQLEGLKDKHGSRICISLGIEMGFGPSHIHYYEELARNIPFEFIICSTHGVNGMDLYFDREAYFGTRTKTEAYRAYFKEILENVTVFSCFDVYGHIDYIARYGMYDDNGVYYADFADVIDAILRKLIDNGKGLELNMSGFRYGLNRPHPQIDILKRYRQMGGEIITVGSDAHRPLDIAGDFEKAPDILREAGFNAYTVFKDRKPVWLNLE